MRTPTNFFIQRDCLFRQDRKYERRNIKVMLTGNLAHFYLQQGTSSIKIWDITRIHHSSMEAMQVRFNEIKEKE